jgi:exocyst complex component 4
MCPITSFSYPSRFVILGLASLMDETLIIGSRWVQSTNEHGVSKMHRNILALQQNLRNLGGTGSVLLFDVNFDRSRKFWEMLRSDPQVR